MLRSKTSRLICRWGREGDDAPSPHLTGQVGLWVGRQEVGPRASSMFIRTINVIVHIIKAEVIEVRTESGVCPGMSKSRLGETHIFGARTP